MNMVPFLISWVGMNASNILFAILLVLSVLASVEFLIIFIFIAFLPEWILLGLLAIVLFIFSIPVIIVSLVIAIILFALMLAVVLIICAVIVAAFALGAFMIFALFELFLGGWIVMALGIACFVIWIVYMMAVFTGNTDLTSTMEGWF